MTIASVVTWHWAYGLGWHWVDIAAAVATTVAAYLALVAILTSKHEAKASQDALVNERRIDFELTVLRELADLIESPSVSLGGTRGVKVRARMLPTAEMPWLSTIVGTTALQEVVDRRKALGQGPTASIEQNLEREAVERDNVRKEVAAAIARRLTARGEFK